MKQAYIEKKFNVENEKLVVFLDELIDTYQAAGYMLSVRQLYYQLVSRDVVENTERSYKRVASIINDARLAGRLDWDAIEDRGRDIVVRNRWNNGGEVLRASAQQFHMDMWEGQETRVFIIVEKAALAGVLERPAHLYDVPLLAAKGYPSVSVVRELVEDQLLPAIRRSEQSCLILHLGDHDPSGLDMTRDLQERIALFLEDDSHMVDVQRIALQMHQVQHYKPPPNPAKATDSRFIDYQREHGNESWELDALEPSVLDQLVTQHIVDEIDTKVWKARKAEIEAVKKRLLAAAEEFGV